MRISCFRGNEELLKGDFLNDYEFSFQLSGLSEQDMAGSYPVYVDKDNYVKAQFNGATRMLEVTAVKKGKTAWKKEFSLGMPANALSGCEVYRLH